MTIVCFENHFFLATGLLRVSVKDDVISVLKSSSVTDYASVRIEL